MSLTAGTTDRTLDLVNKKVAMRLLPLFFLCYIVAYLDRINISFAKLQMASDTGLSDASYAIGASIFFWSYMVFEIPSNLLLKRVGARIWIARIMVTWGIVSISTMFIAPLATFFHTTPLTVFYVLRCLLGACEAGFLPGVLFYIACWVPSQRQSRVFAAFLTSLPVSLMVGGPLSGWIMRVSAGFGHFQGWQWLFLIEGLPSILMGVAVWVCLPKDIASARWLSDVEKQTLCAALATEQVHKVERLGTALRDGRVWLLIVILLALNTGFYGLSFWLPSIIHKGGVTDTFSIGLLSAIPWLVSIPCLLVNAAHSNRTGERRLHAALPALFGGLAFVASAVCAGHFALSLTFLTLAIGSLMASFPIYWTFPNQILSGTAAAGGLALINSVGALAGVFGSVASALAGALTGNINDGTYAFGACALLGGTLILLLPRQVAVSTAAPEQRGVSAPSA